MGRLPSLRDVGRALVLAGWVASSGAAWAGPPVPPTRPDRAVLVKTASGPEIFHLLQGGEPLSFRFEEAGPATVVARRRLPAATITPPPVPVEVLGDGERFLVMRVGQAHDPAATIHDAGGGAPSAPDVARVDVPEGGRTLTFRLEPGAPDVFVRVEVGAPPAR